MDEAVRLPENFQLDPVFLYDAIAKSTDDYIYVIDMKSGVAVVSENMCSDFALEGRLVNDLVANWGKLVHPRDQSAFFDSIDDIIKGESDVHIVEYQVKNRKGEYVWLNCRGRVQRDAQGVLITFAGMVTNISYTGRIDYVSGLFNQLECSRDVERRLERQDLPAGLLLLGLDDFTRINDLHGHAFGDLVLRQFAQEVQRMLPPGSAMYRCDGDEFAILLNGGPERMEDLYKTVQAYSEIEHALDGERYYFTVSAGGARLWEDGKSYISLLQCAASAMDVSKQTGKSRYTSASEDILRPRMRSQELADQLQSCILKEMEGFSLLFQPIVAADTLRVVGAEALLRWSSDSLGSVSAEEFIPLLESSSMIISVGKWVLRESLRISRPWIERVPDFTLNVNVSFLQILDQSFVSYVEAAVQDNCFTPENLVLELTERCFVSDRMVLDSSFRELKRLGIRLAMDDFGTGYSSIGMLCASPTDIVKIDRIFTASIGDGAHAFNSDFIRAVIQLCHSVGIKVCVEGVETEQELLSVKAIGSDTIQGFYISVPIAAKEFEQRFLPR